MDPNECGRPTVTVVRPPLLSLILILLGLVHLRWDLSIHTLGLVHLYWDPNERGSLVDLWSEHGSSDRANVGFQLA